MIKLATTNIKNDKMSDLVDKSTKKSYLKQPFSGPSTLSDSVFQVLVILSTPVVITISSQNDEKIDNLTDIMQTLALSIRILQSNTNATLTILQPDHLSTNALLKLFMQINFRGF